MSNKVENNNQLQVASFSLARKRNYKTTDLIIALIEKSIQEQAAITRDDIQLLYWFYKTEGETKEIPVSREWVNGEGWKDFAMDKQTFINHWRNQRNAISWFKSGLASAVLEGRLLILPIINI